MYATRPAIALALSFVALVACRETAEAPQATAPVPDRGDLVSQQPADYVFANGRIYTVDASQPWAEAVVVEGDEIVYVGDTETAKGYVGEDTEFVELGGRMMLPGFVESHIHTTVGAAFGQGLWLAHLDTKEEFIAAIRKYMEQNPDLEVIRGFGWKPFAFPPEGPSKKDLDAISTEKPIFLFDVTAHAAWVNSKTLEMAGIDRDTPDPQPGFSYFKRDAQGEATGWIVEVAAEFGVLNKIDPLTPDYVKQGLRVWNPRWAAAGITTAVDQSYVFQGDAEFQKTGYDALRDLEAEGGLKTRVVTSYYAGDPAVDNLEGYRTLAKASPDTRLLRHRVLKIAVDGDVASHSIRLYEPYLDTGEHGISVFSQEDLNRLVLDAAGENIHMHFHAMGDATVGDVLTAIEAAKQAHPDSSSRFSLAHVFLISPRDFDRFRAIDFVPTFSGNWLAPDPSDVDAKNRMLGDQRLEAWYPFRSLHEKGVRTAFGSDFPAAGAISTYKMLEQIQYAMTRQFLSGKGEVWPPEGERIPLELALEAATLNGAYTVGMEDEIGSIEVGKKADLIVLDQNLFEVDVASIHDTQVILTLVDGEVMHDAFFGLGDVTAGLEVLGLVREQSEEFDQLVADLLANLPEKASYSDHVTACNIGTAVYEYLKQTREE